MEQLARWRAVSVAEAVVVGRADVLPLYFLVTWIEEEEEEEAVILSEW